MSSLKRMVVFLIMILLALCVLIFVLENQQSVSILFLGWASTMLPVSVVIVFALLFGLIVGTLFGCVFIDARRRSNRKA